VIAPEQGAKTRAITVLTALASAVRLLDRDRNLWPRGLWLLAAARRRRVDQAERIFELLIERLQDLDDPDVAHLVALARAYLGVAHMLSGRFAHCARTMDAVWAMGEPAIRIFRTMADHAIAREGRSAAFAASAALIVVGFIHEGMGQRTQAAAAYTECIDRFRRNRSPLVATNVLLARLSRRTVKDR
jgi:hypothetical protein